MARPTKLTRDLLDKLDTIAGDAWSIEDACAQLSIAEATWHSWRRDAEAGAGGMKAEFLTLAARVGPKRRELAWGAIRTVLENPAARDSDRVSAALGILRLDHTTRAAIELTGADGAPLTERPDLSKLTTDELVQLRDLMAKAAT